MRRFLVLVLASLMVSGSAGAQGKRTKPESPAKLELSVEIATTDDDGNPSALRITITNVGGAPVDMPVLQEGCAPENGIRVQAIWSTDSSGIGVGRGNPCGIFDGPSLEYRMRREWVRLRSGEFMTATRRAGWTDFRRDGSGTVEYWVEYTPPAFTDEQAARLQRAGYIIPTEKLETKHSSFHIP
jgi:hypothetical protein